MYIKSIYTGQVYEADRMPKFGGYVKVSEKEYKNYLKKLDK